MENILPVQKNKGGRPKKFASPQWMKKLAQDFFIRCQNDETTPTVLGFSLHLDIPYRTLLDYGNDEEFSPVVEMVKSRCENWLLQDMLKGKSNAATGMFILKNLGKDRWKDKQEIQTSGTTDHIINVMQYSKKLEDSKDT